MKAIRRLFIIVVGCGMQPTLYPALAADSQSRSINLEMEYITEWQTDLSRSNWLNLLTLSASAKISQSFAFEAKTISIARTDESRVFDDLQVFSNIEEDNLALAPAMLGLHWRSPSGRTALFFGVHNVNDDYFVSPCTSLFSNSSCGIFPTISANYDIANYPFASLGVDFKQYIGRFLLQASVYNGQGYNRFTGRDCVFRFCPGSDGIFGITALNYDYDDYSSYTVGCAAYHGLRSHNDLGGQAVAPASKETSCAPWVNIEQRICSPLSLIAQASIDLGRAPACKHYGAIGAVASFGPTTSGVILTYADFVSAHEIAIEITSQISLSESLYIQPACHIIRSDGRSHCVGLLRFGLTLGN